MEVKITPQPTKSEAEIQVTLTASELKPYIERAARKLTKDQPLKGFRPGKAPLDVVIETYGTESLLHEALDRAVPHYYVQAALENNVDAIGRPAITVQELSLQKGLSFTATAAVLPEVKLGDVTQLSVGKREIKVSDEEVEKELQYLAKLRSTPIEVARPAQSGDTVTLDFKVSLNGTIMPGGESKNHPVHIGEGHFVPGFEQKLEGLQANEEREFTLKFPADYASPELRDKEANVWVKAHAVQKRVIPELNDEFAKKLGKFENLGQLQQELKNNMQQEKEQKEQDRFQGALAEAVAEQATYGPIPEILIDREIDRRISEFTQMLSYQQKTMEDYLREQNKSIKDVRDDMRDSAIRGVKVGLALRAYAEEQELKADDKEVTEKVNEYLQRFASTKEAAEAVDKEELTESITSTLRNQLTLKELESKVKVTVEKKEVETAPKASADKK